MGKVIEGKSSGAVDVGRTRVVWSLGFEVKVRRESRRKNNDPHASGVSAANDR